MGVLSESLLMYKTMAAKRTWLSIALMFCSLLQCGSKRILLMPFPFPSHVGQLQRIGETMLERGHEVFMFVPESYTGLKRLQKSKIQLIIHQSPDPDFNSPESSVDSDNLLEEMISMDIVTDMRVHIDGFREICTNALGDTEVLDRIRTMHFDLVIVDIFPSARCFMVIVHKLGLPFVAITTAYEPWLSRNPALPSFVPFNWGSGRISDKMNFWERLENLYKILDWALAPRVAYMEQTFIDSYLPDKDKGLSLNSMVGRAELFLIDTDFVIDYPRPSMPNEVLIGGMTTGPAKPLSEELEKFVSAAKEGIVVVSFGSYGGNIPKHVSEKLMKAFSMIPQRVVMRYPHSAPTDLPQNVKLMEWMPQNDLLGHSNTKAFITHCGANGQFEGLYHAVPMINFPLFAEQPYNAKRADQKGIATTMGLLDFTPEKLAANIQTVITDQSFKLRATKLSKIFRSRPETPSQRAVYWVEHVLEFGGKHLRSSALDMPWYQYLMLDIFAFLLTLCIYIHYVVCRVLNCFTRKCFHNKKEKIQ